MANSSGAAPDLTIPGPPTATPPTDPPTSPDKKKLFIALGVAGIAILGIGGFLLMNSRSNDTDTTVATVSTNSVTPVASDTSGAGAPVTAIPVVAPGIGTVGNPTTLLPLSRYRRDPFVPFIIPPPPPTPAPPVPTPVPLPRPTPIPEPVVLPPIESISIPRPGRSGRGGNDAFAVPGANDSAAAANRPLILPTVVIPRLNATRTVPTNAFPPPRSSSGAGSAVASPSFDKRLSGVVIGNGVRAVLEISGGVTSKSYVVQPGDVVEGITILNIQRFNEGGAQVTRMLIRENGGERTVDLKPGPPRATAGGEFGSEGFGGAGGFPGGAGGFQGDGGGFQRGQGGFRRG